jgi:hypothetical protein
MNSYEFRPTSEELILPNELLSGKFFDVMIREQGARKPEKIFGVDGEVIPYLLSQYCGIDSVILQEIKQIDIN